MPHYCIIAHDRTGPGGPERRQAYRRAHFERIKPYVECGAVLLAGSMLDGNGAMAASVLIVDFLDRETLDAWLAEEPYVTHGVWERIEVNSMFVAVDGSGITQRWLSLMQQVPPILSVSSASKDRK